MDPEEFFGEGRTGSHDKTPPMLHGPVRLVGALGRPWLAAALLPGLAAAAEAPPEIAVQRLGREVQIDGRLEAQEWSGAARVDSFVQLEPRLEGLPLPPVVADQTNSSIRRRNVQASLVWRYRPPFGSFQLVFQRGTAAFGQPSSQGNTLFTKFSYVF
jgi:hypothetical protein